MRLKFLHEIFYNPLFKKYNFNSTHCYNRNIPPFIIFPWLIHIGQCLLYTLFDTQKYFIDSQKVTRIKGSCFLCAFSTFSFYLSYLCVIMKHFICSFKRDWIICKSKYFEIQLTIRNIILCEFYWWHFDASCIYTFSMILS